MSAEKEDKNVYLSFRNQWNEKINWKDWDLSLLEIRIGTFEGFITFNLIIIGFEIAIQIRCGK